jgi:hypothetical protein
LAESHSGSFALAVVIAPVLVITVLLTALGGEARGIAFGSAQASEGVGDDDRAERFGHGEDARLRPAQRARAD